MAKYRKVINVLAELRQSLEEIYGDHWHGDAQKDRTHSQAVKLDKPGAERCPPGSMRNKTTGRCEAIRGVRRA